jgi:hypothetical protein
VFVSFLNAFLVFLEKYPNPQLNAPPKELPTVATPIKAHTFSGNFTKYPKKTASELNGINVADKKESIPTEDSPIQGIDKVCKKECIKESIRYSRPSMIIF